MTSGSEAWTLIARFSNKDTVHWMNDSGYWWYDRTEAAGENTDPLTNADMISPAFWLVSGNELKSRVLTTLSILLCCRLLVTVLVERHFALKSLPMVTLGMAKNGSGSNVWGIV